MLLQCFGAGFVSFWASRILIRNVRIRILDVLSTCKISVVDPRCLSRILILTIPDRIPNPGSRIQKQEQKRGVKKNLLSNLFMQPQISQKCKLFYF
jgi:hypothetical protein